MVNRGATRTPTRPPLERPGGKPASQKVQKGAVQSKTGIAGKWTSYWSHHGESCIESLRRLLRTPLQTLMTVAVVAIALALPATMLVALNNLTQLGQSWEVKPKISVFVNVRAREAAIEQVVQAINGYPEVADVTFLSADEALQEFVSFSGFGEALNSLDQNPLPATIIVTPKVTAMEPGQLRLLAERVREHAIVEEVSMDMDWVRRLQELMVLGRKIVLALASLLSVGVLLVIGNTIRLAIENRRDEIVVCKLVGGTNSFVRRPFLYSGWWYGVFGGVLACFIVGLGMWVVEPSVARLAVLYDSGFLLRGLGGLGSMQLMLISAGLGLLGAWVAVSRHLADIEPR